MVRLKFCFSSDFFFDSLCLNLTLPSRSWSFHVPLFTTRRQVFKLRFFPSPPSFFFSRFRALFFFFFQGSFPPRLGSFFHVFHVSVPRRRRPSIICLRRSGVRPNGGKPSPSLYLQAQGQVSPVSFSPCLRAGTSTPC